MTTLLYKIVDLLLQVFGALRARPRIAVKILEDNIEKELGGLEFEIENRRWNITSLDPHIKRKFYYIDKEGIKKGIMSYNVRESDRKLEPFKPKILHATHDKHHSNLPWSWYRTYVFYPTSGLKANIRLRDCFFEPLTWYQFIFEFIRFRLFKRFKNYNSMTFDDYERLKRSQGPH